MKSLATSRWDKKKRWRPYPRLFRRVNKNRCTFCNKQSSAPPKTYSSYLIWRVWRRSIDLKRWLLVALVAKTLIEILIFRISHFQLISCGCKFCCKRPHIMCLSSCKSNDNLRNIITEGIPYLATVCRMVCASLHICSSSRQTWKNVSDFCVIPRGYC